MGIRGLLVVGSMLVYLWDIYWFRFPGESIMLAALLVPLVLVYPQGWWWWWWWGGGQEWAGKDSNEKRVKEDRPGRIKGSAKSD